MDDRPTVFIATDDRVTRRKVTALVKSMGLPVKAFSTATELLRTLDVPRPGCVVADAEMADMAGLELLDQLGRRKTRPPVIFLCAGADVPTAVRVMKAGAFDFLEKPWGKQELHDTVREALERDADNRRQWRRVARVQRRMARLTPGERDVQRLVLQGKSNRAMAERLGLSVRAVEVRRAKLMRKMRARSAAELARLTLLAGEPTVPSHTLPGRPR